MGDHHHSAYLVPLIFLLGAFESPDDLCLSPSASTGPEAPQELLGHGCPSLPEPLCLEAQPGQFLSLWKPNFCCLGRRLEAQPSQLWKFPGGLWNQVGVPVRRRSSGEQQAGTLHNLNFLFHMSHPDMRSPKWMYFFPHSVNGDES